MASLYSITNDIDAVLRLFESAVDDEGNPRDLTEKEQAYLCREMTKSVDDAAVKLENYGKLYKNFLLKADNVDSERKNFKAEMDRLSKRAKAYTNKAESLKNGIRYFMDTCKEKKVETETFTFNIQNTQLKVSALEGDTLKNVPECFLKPRELDSMSIKNAMKNGDLVQGKAGTIDEFSLFDREGKRLEGVRVQQGTALVIR